MGREFERSINPKLLSAATLQDYPLLAQLLDIWAPAGTDSANGRFLRLAIRDGYLSFYTLGQTLFEAKFHKNAQKITFRIHENYVNGDAPTGGKSHCSFSGKSTLVDLETWRNRAATYRHRKAEKAFVDALLGANVGVIDIEATMPTGASDQGEGNVAPRMDLVVLEPAAGGYRLAFWEAKLADNKEARAAAGRTPAVVSQLDRYRQWLMGDGHRERLVGAYAETCRAFVKLHEMARTLRPDLAPLGAAIRDVGEGKAEIVDIDPKIRIIIDNTGSYGGDPSPSFTSRGHAEALRRAGIPLLVIGEEDSLVLTPPA